MRPITSRITHQMTLFHGMLPRSSLRWLTDLLWTLGLFRRRDGPHFHRAGRMIPLAAESDPRTRVRGLLTPYAAACIRPSSDSKARLSVPDWCSPLATRLIYKASTPNRSAMQEQ